MALFSQSPRFSVYLAGPQVFLPNPHAFATAARAALAPFGLETHFPLDLDVQIADHPTLQAAAFHIAQLNFDLIDRCDAVLVCLTPFRGVCPDDGTMVELGYAHARGKTIFGYGTDPRGMFDRAWDGKDPCSMTPIQHHGAMIPTDPDGLAIEDFSLNQNLMIEAAIAKSGGAIFYHPAPTPSDRFTDIQALTRAGEALATRLEVMAMDAPSDPLRRRA